MFAVADKARSCTCLVLILTYSQGQIVNEGARDETLPTSCLHQRQDIQPLTVSDAMFAKMIWRRLAGCLDLTLALKSPRQRKTILRLKHGKVHTSNEKSSPTGLLPSQLQVAYNTDEGELNYVSGL